MMHTRLLQQLTIACLCLTPVVAQADIYVYTDANGVSHFSNVASHDGYELVVKETATPPVANSKVKHFVSQRKLKPKLLAHINQSAKKNQIQSELIQAVIQVESAYQPKAKSHKGAQGLMQLMPQTAKRFGVKDSYDPAQNIEGGAQYLKTLLGLFDDDLSLTLAAYNAGEHAVIKHGYKIPPYKETQAYVPKVLSIYKALLKQNQQHI